MITKKLPLLAFLILLSATLSAQTRYKIVTPTVTFFAGTPVEDIDAHSDKLVGVIDVDKNIFAFQIAMNSFQFKRELMQEHYNENYLETETYPNAIFKGNIEEPYDFTTDGVYPVKAVGTFNVHGIEKEYTVNATITVANSLISIEATFPILLEDHEIDRPKIVLMKIAEQADVTVKASLEKI